MITFFFAYLLGCNMLGQYGGGVDNKLIYQLGGLLIQNEIQVLKKTLVRVISAEAYLFKATRLCLEAFCIYQFRNTPYQMILSVHFFKTLGE
jgi:hypothetical protein